MEILLDECELLGWDRGRADHPALVIQSAARVCVADPPLVLELDRPDVDAALPASHAREPVRVVEVAAEEDPGRFRGGAARNSSASHPSVVQAVAANRISVAGERRVKPLSGHLPGRQAHPPVQAAFGADCVLDDRTPRRISGLARCGR